MEWIGKILDGEVARTDIWPAVAEEGMSRILMPHEYMAHAASAYDSSSLCTTALFFFCQREYELQSAALAVLRRDGTSVNQYGVFYDGQSQAGTSQFA